jgi:hypothetical protein
MAPPPRTTIIAAMMMDLATVITLPLYRYYPTAVLNGQEWGRHAVYLEARDTDRALRNARRFTALDRAATEYAVSQISPYRDY